MQNNKGMISYNQVKVDCLSMFQWNIKQNVYIIALANQNVYIICISESEWIYFVLLLTSTIIYSMK